MHVAERNQFSSCTRGTDMASEASEQMMALLHELSMLKGLNIKYEINPTDSGQKEDRLRQQRHEEITLEIRTLGDQQKNSVLRTTQT
jgi:hypothetical protein